jgi:hypothetical protein
MNETEVAAAAAKAGESAIKIIASREGIAIVATGAAASPSIAAIGIVGIFVLIGFSIYRLTK